MGTLLLVWGKEITQALRYRLDLLVGLASSLGWAIVAVVPVVVATDPTLPLTGDWTRARLLVLVGMFLVLDGFVWSVIVPNIAVWPAMVLDGTMDLWLILPIHSLAVLSLRRFDVRSLPKLAIGAGVAVIGVVQSGGVQLLGIGCFLLSLPLACLVLWSAAVLISSLCFLVVRIDVMFATNGLHNVSRIPVDLFAPSFRTVLWVIPVAALTTVPTRALFLDVNVGEAAVIVATTALFTTLAIYVFRKASAKYQSGMG